ncbi:MAG TPA: alpha/beta hydrolase [Solirubrobacteraceae bacterium]|nr:alpha/beta hydrolase [Solirubrobacteraceae bacterium]
MTDRTPDTIVLIHGLWMTPRSWEHWVARYESRGFKVLAPAWPGLEGEVEALNADPSPIADLEVTAIVDHYERIIRELPAPPIVMGHSFGGTFTQVLLDRGLGAAGVGIASATVKGILDLPLSTLKSTSPVLANPLNRHNAVGLTQKEFHYAFANTLDREESDAIHARYHVPGSSHVLREGAFANLHRHPATEVDFDRPDRAPLLLVAFGEDHIVPPKVARHNAEKYKSGLVEFMEFPDRPHFPGVAGWEDVADRALEWATANAGARGATVA